jgi:hypothetical protein
MVARRCCRRATIYFFYRSFLLAQIIVILTQIKPAAMKQFTRILVVILFLVIVDIACNDDEPFYSIDPYETLLIQHVNDYRATKGLDELVLWHDVLATAREHSAEWKKTGDVTSGLQARIDDIIDRWEPTNLGVITSIGWSAHRDSAINVVNSWINDSLSNVILIDDYTHSSPGMVVGDHGEVYITNFFLNLPY